ncbi:GSCOCG00001581001-RA-CDS [Cotesia congregata]|uniref:Similar to hb: Protein hunchback (Bombyx mori) n=1 Tax=Cotesia congregata TaxID=51543 RepID=A0A8J2HPJ0_COTCN
MKRTTMDNNSSNHLPLSLHIDPIYELLRQLQIKNYSTRESMDLIKRSPPYLYTPPYTSPQREENHNGFTGWINPSGSHSVTSTQTSFWENFSNFTEPVRKYSESYYSDSENSHPRSLPSPEEQTSPPSNPPSPYGFVEKPIISNQGASTSSNVAYQQFPSQKSPSPDLKSSPAVRITKLKETLQKKKMKKEMNNMEFIRQNMPAKSSSKQVYQHRELSQSPVPSTSSMETCHQEQSIPTNVCQDDVNLTSPNNVGAPTSTKSSVVYMKKPNSRRRKPVRITRLKLTREVYETAPGIKIPRFSKGKIKSVKCKYCKILFDTKHELWIHLRIHLKPNKRFECSESYCSFVTNLHHHIVYHECSHLGIRPFRCNQCSYTATNKAMLKSHEKSHADFYLYVCKDCGFGNQYVSNLKKHLEYTKHNKVIRAFDKEGNEFELEIDVYGKTRGPKKNTTPKKANPKQKPTADTTPASSECLRDNLLQENLVEAQNLGRQDAQSGNLLPIIDHYNAQSLYSQSLYMSNPSDSQIELTNSSVNSPLYLSLLAAIKNLSTVDTPIANSMEISSDEVGEIQPLDLSMKNSNNTSSNTGRSSGASKRKGKTITKYVNK